MPRLTGTTFAWPADRRAGIEADHELPAAPQPQAQFVTAGAWRQHRANAHRHDYPNYAAKETMMRTYEYHGFTIEVAVEADFTLRPAGRAAARTRYTAVVHVYQSGNAVTAFSPLRLDTAGGRRFDTEADALMAGYSAARRIVDDLFARAADAADSALSALKSSKEHP